MAEIDLSKWKNIGGYLLRAGGFFTNYCWSYNANNELL